jgi:hypothetical protein
MQRVRIGEAGFGKEELNTLQKLINAEKSDLFDVLEYVFNSDIKPITREERVTRAKATIFALLNDKQKEFIEFVLSKYIETGVKCRGERQKEERRSRIIRHPIPVWTDCCFAIRLVYWNAVGDRYNRRSSHCDMCLCKCYSAAIPMERD